MTNRSDGATALEFADLITKNRYSHEWRQEASLAACALATIISMERGGVDRDAMLDWFDVALVKYFETMADPSGN